MVMDKVWAGVDAGKEFHWAHVLDAAGRQSLSRRVENAEADILKLIDEALSRWPKRLCGQWISQGVALRSC